MPSQGVLLPSAQLMVHGEPENPHGYFSPLSSPNSKIFLKWYSYRLFTFLNFFPADSLKPDLLAEEGFYLTKNQEVTCQFCYNISIPLEEARIELGGMNKTELRSWHKEKAQYCRVATNEILANDFYGNQNSKRCIYGFRVEANRLASLLAATIQDQSIWGLVNALDRCRDLAKDGFYYLGPRDKVRCAFCNLEVYEWETMDRVHDEHMKFNSKCPLHSLGPSSTGNVRIGEEQTGEVSTDAVVFAEMSEKHLGHRRLLSFPIYMDLQARIDSFDLNKWPHFQHYFLAADKMAQCGLFYTGQGDKVACYKCGIGLHKWEEDDVPREVHARYSPDCQVA